MTRRVGMRNIPAAAALVLFASVVGACGGGHDKAAPPPTTATTTAAAVTTSRVPPTTSPAATAPTGATIDCNNRRSGGSGGFMNLVAVRVGTHEGYDRVTFEFKAPAGHPGGQPATLPNFEIKDARLPLMQDPSGKPLTVQGAAFLQVVLHGSTSTYTFDASGRQVPLGVTVPDRVPAGFDVVREVVEQGDFEAVDSWVLGLSRSSCLRVLDLQDPVRLVVDVAH